MMKLARFVGLVGGLGKGLGGTGQAAALPVKYVEPPAVKPDKPAAKEAKAEDEDGGFRLRALAIAALGGLALFGILVFLFWKRPPPSTDHR
jgi:hypothetical protein